MKTNRGFTLIELMVVISLITMFSSIVLATIQPIRAQARDAKRKQEIHQLDLAIQQYIADRGYPPDLAACKAIVDWSSKRDQLSSCMAVSTASVDTPEYGAWLLLKSELIDYINLPNDPCGTDCDNGLGYTYNAPLATQIITDGASSDYQVSGRLENGSVTSGGTGGSGKITAPVVNIFLIPEVPIIGQKLTVRWTSTNAASCSLGTLDQKYGLFVGYEDLNVNLNSEIYIDELDGDSLPSTIIITCYSGPNRTGLSTAASETVNVSQVP